MENRNNRKNDVRNINEQQKSYNYNNKVLNPGKQFYVYPYMRRKPNLQIERLCEQKGLKFERKTWKMMQVNLAEKKEEKEKEKLSLEDFQDEDKMNQLMSQVLYLTQDDLDR